MTQKNNLISKRSTSIQKKKRTTTRELNTISVVGFGLGDFGFGLFWTSTNLYLLYFYTDVLGLSNSVAGAIFMVAMIWDGISDPLVGYIAGSRKGKKGQYRPYLLWGALPLAFSFTLLFYNPNFENHSLIVYTLVSHIFFRTCYTFVSVPYGALMAQMTNISNERSSLAVSRMLCAAGAGIAVAIAMLELATRLGKGDLNQGFFFSACILAAISLPFFFAAYYFTKEDNLESCEQSERIPSLSDSVSMLRQNTPFILFFFAVVLGMMSSTIADKISVYYMIYALDAKQTMGAALAFFGLITAISLPFWGWVSNHTSKRHVWLWGLAILFFTSISIFFTPITDLNSIFPFWITSAIAKGALFFSFWATFPDTVEFGEWKSGVRSPAFLTGISTFAQKVSLGLGIGLLGIFLDLINYQPNVVQSVETIGSMKSIMTLLPAAVYCIVFFLVFRYPINQQLHSRLVSAIEIRRQRSNRMN